MTWLQQQTTAMPHHHQMTRVSAAQCQRSSTKRRGPTSHWYYHTVDTHFHAASLKAYSTSARRALLHVPCATLNRPLSPMRMVVLRTGTLSSACKNLVARGIRWERSIAGASCIRFLASAQTFSVLMQSHGEGFIAPVAQRDTNHFGASPLTGSTIRLAQQWEDGGREPKSGAGKRAAVAVGQRDAQQKPELGAVPAYSCVVRKSPRCKACPGCAHVGRQHIACKDTTSAGTHVRAYILALCIHTICDHADIHALDDEYVCLSTRASTCCECMFSELHLRT